MAWPRLSEGEPVIGPFSLVKVQEPPRLCATCAAATHWPRFLNSLHATRGSWPMSVCSFEVSLGFRARSWSGVFCPELVLLEAPRVSELPRERSEPGVLGGPPGPFPPPPPCWASAGTPAERNSASTAGIIVVRFMVCYLLFWARGSLLV